MAETYDVVIAGGAVIGSSVAYHLARHAGFKGRVLVIERDRTYAQAASALSASSIRQQFSQPVNILISLYGIDFLRNIEQHLAVDGDAPAIGLKEGGYLYVAGESGMQVLAENHEIQTRLGADITLLDADSLKERFAWLATDDLTGGSFGETGEGWFDGYGVMQAFGKKARSLGVTYRQDEVTALALTGDRVTAVTLASGEAVRCGMFVNTCGAWGARHVAGMAGIALPVFAKKRSVFYFDCATKLRRFPLLIDTSGVWVRPEGEGFIAGYSPDDETETDQGRDFDVNWGEFEEVIWPSLAARIPAFEAIKPGRAWAGHYDMNLLDHNAIVGRMGGLANAYLAAGFSGHGLQQAPAVGRGLVELMVDGRYTSLDIGDLGYERVIAKRPLLEKNVI